MPELNTVVALYFIWVSFLQENFVFIGCQPSNRFRISLRTLERLLSQQKLSIRALISLIFTNNFVDLASCMDTIECIKSMFDKEPMGHIAHLRKQFKSMNTNFIITLIRI